jgi:pimeloyl-ACP methyl ester carboxylesterase
MVREVPEMTTRRLLGLNPGGFHRVAYHQWGRAGAGRPVVCVHGLSRNGRDFDALALALRENHLVVCPDMVGRGESDWLPDPAGYGMPQYLADMTALLARLDTDEVDWVGTSMGGLIGMTLAAQPQTPIRRLVINDIGPFVPQAALARLAPQVPMIGPFEDLRAAEAHMRERYAGFGALSDRQWRHLAEHSFRPRAEGGVVMRYDPAIGENFRAAAEKDLDLWAVWDVVRCPVLVVRGADSDVLPRKVAEEMTRRGPRARVVEIDGCAHAPSLMDDQQINLVGDWLEAG